MRRARWISGAVLAVLVGVAIGVGAYNAGVSHGLAQSGHATQVVRVVGGGFPFGFLFFPLFFFLIFFGLRAALWGRRWRDGHPHGDWGPEGRLHGREQAFEDWHRRQHEGGTGDRADSGGTGHPATV